MDNLVPGVLAPAIPSTITDFATGGPGASWNFSPLAFVAFDSKRWNRDEAVEKKCLHNGPSRPFISRALREKFRNGLWSIDDKPLFIYDDRRDARLELLMRGLAAATAINLPTRTQTRTYPGQSLSSYPPHTYLETLHSKNEVQVRRAR